MKILILNGILALTLLPLSGRADLLIYKGILIEKTFGANEQQRLSLKTVAIIDHDTGNFALVSFGNLARTKRLFTEQHTNSHLVVVTGPKGTTGSAITKIPSSCEVQETPGIEGLYLKGINGTLTANTNSSVSFPRVLTEGGAGLAYASGLPLVVEEKFTLVFNQPQTIASNQAGETLDAAFSRIVSELQSVGYTP